ncbi:AUGMIN subunit 6 isoform X3 [Physcomitrium patens]|uniref:HAUS augmin-like complex subunit 6 N-terminal domain-containing protein n=1 Tax=Physcomitrium patens TaxID=3218 RepID=A0A7I4AKP1_PHYPA|nr:AUGMIN subunit 6-like isoform X3 [Physcomitrium patens]|eukprot:XP_024393138.1 AUGMIN subunit 6-like isoform X3 [Physcomitrella patens]
MLIGTGNVRGRKRRREKEMWRQHYIRTVSSLDLILMCLGRELDFAGVWPIFDAAQSRDFRKVVQGLINELESQGALPRSNSRVSSLATCCGQRFVELLWHLSAHALREVHRRTFPADVASNPLPASLTELVCPNTRPVSLLAVTKARIALERKRFMKGATQAVERQTSWSNLAHDMTAEYRALCAEEAFQHQELEKLQESSYPNVSDDSAVSDTEGFVTSISAGPVIRASQLWKGILSHSERVAELASGPIEDLIARREHRYRIDGAVLRAAVDLGSVNLPVESSSCSTADYDSQRPRFEVGVSTEDDKSTKTPPPVDVGEILRRWTHALQTVHKQTLRLARSNNGAGPELMMESTHGEESVHVHSLRTTLGEHKQHFSSLRSLKNQLEASMPGMEAAITTLRERVDGPDTMAASRAAQNALIVTSKTSHWVATSREEDLEQSALEFINNSAMPLELTPPSPALKLPYTSPSANGVSTFSKAASGISSMPSLDVLQEQEGLESNGIVWNGGCEITEGISSLRQAVIEAALQKPNSVVRDITQQPTNTEHYFTPVSPFQMHAKSSREIVSVVTDTNQPPTYIGKDDVPTFIPSENRDRTVEEKNGYVADPQNFVRRGVSPMSRKGLNGRQHVERSSWKSPHDLPQRTSELHVHDFQPLSPSLFLDCNSFDRTFDGTYDNLLAPMTDLDSAFMSIGDRRETRAI